MVTSNALKSSIFLEMRIRLCTCAVAAMILSAILIFLRFRLDNA